MKQGNWLLYHTSSYFNILFITFKTQKVMATPINNTTSTTVQLVLNLMLGPLVWLPSVSNKAARRRRRTKTETKRPR